MLPVTGPDPSAPDDFLIGQMADTFANQPQNPYHCGAGYTAPSQRYGAASIQMLGDIGARDLDEIAAGAGNFEDQLLLMAGAGNDWTRPDLQRFDHSLFSNANVVVIDDAEHEVVWDNPVASVAGIRSFLSGIDVYERPMRTAAPWELGEHQNR